jgi:hypothetical protein
MKLATSLTGPAVSRPDFANLGITKQWRADMAREVNRQLAKAKGKGLPASFLESDAVVQRAVRKTLSGTFVFDDYPRVEIEMILEDGRKILASSASSAPFMLPWTVMKKDGEMGSMDANIGRAVAELAPEGFTNRERLRGDAYLRDQVIRSMVTYAQGGQ